MGRRLVIDANQAADIADIERKIVGLDAESGPPRVCLEAIARLLLRAEAVASSFIEGLQINVRRLAKAAVAEQTGLPAHDETARAVLGNVKAMHSAIERAGKERLGVEDILDIHTELLAGTRDARFGGVVRTEQNWVGGRGLSPCGADYVPPPPELVPELLADLCDYMNSDEHPALVQAALAHAQFETIHPFADGNGRTGRALIHLVLRRRGLARNFTVPISLILASHADAYIGSLVAYRHEGDWASSTAQDAAQEYVDRFVADAAGACAKVQYFRDEAARLEAEWRARVGRVRKGSSTDVLLGFLPSVPVLTVATAAALIGRTPQRVNDAVNRLTEAGVLKQTTIGRRNRAYEVPDLLRVLTGFERALASPAGDTAQAPPTRPVPARPRRERRR